MYKETDENGQYQLDCRLSSERSLEENTNIMIDFAHDIVKAQKPGVIKNRHEGYGILAEAMCVLNLQTKAVGDGMKNFLTNLSSDDDIRAIERAESISNALADTIVAAVAMAAWAKRIGQSGSAMTFMKGQGVSALRWKNMRKRWMKTDFQSRRMRRNRNG